VTPKLHPARPGSPWRAVAIAAVSSLGAVGALSAPRLGIPAVVAVAIAGGAAALTVLCLPSFSTRRASVLVLGVGALGALRHAALPSSDSHLVVFWAMATLVALVLVDRADAESTPALVGAPPLAPRVSEAARAAVAIGAVVAMLSVAVVPTLTRELGRQEWLGKIPTLGDVQNSPGSLRASHELDMTNRPRLTDTVVFTVDAERPDFWRGEVFDVWNGVGTWSRSDDSYVTLARSDGTVPLVLDPYDVGAQRGEEMQQTFYLESRFSQLIFAAPSAVEVNTDLVLVGRPDGTAGVLRGLGQGAVYTVTSKNLKPTADVLRAADATPLPAPVRTRYAQVPLASERVRALAESITRDAATTYDKIRAIEAWLGANTEYSLDAPLSPKGVDVVDHFLFDSRLGWCEQVASSLVVLARSVGIPARLATGFVPGERDGLAGRFVVRENDAHAWTEVFFPGVGWQGFDPTASVPLAGDAPTNGSWFDWARDHVATFALVLGGIVLAVGAAPDLIARARRRVRRRNSWPARALVRLEKVGRASGRPRQPAEGPGEYARVLAAGIGDERLVAVGAVIDRDAFSGSGTSEDARAHADAVLSELTGRPRRE